MRGSYPQENLQVQAYAPVDLIAYTHSCKVEELYHKDSDAVVGQHQRHQSALPKLHDMIIEDFFRVESPGESSSVKSQLTLNNLVFFDVDLDEFPRLGGSGRL